LDEVFARLEIETPPLCSACKGRLRPAVVFFEEALNPQILSHRRTQQISLLWPESLDYAAWVLTYFLNKSEWEPVLSKMILSPSIL
jgi:hypothetical protein